MLIKFRRYDAEKNEAVLHIITNVAKCQCGVRKLFYWKVGAPKWMYLIDLLEVSDVRIENETTKDS